MKSQVVNILCKNCVGFFVAWSYILMKYSDTEFQSFLGNISIAKYAQKFKVSMSKIKGRCTQRQKKKQKKKNQFVVKKIFSPEHEQQAVCNRL